MRLLRLKRKKTLRVFATLREGEPLSLRMTTRLTSRWTRGGNSLPLKSFSHNSELREVGFRPRQLHRYALSFETTEYVNYEIDFLN